MAFKNYFIKANIGVLYDSGSIIDDEVVDAVVSASIDSIEPAVWELCLHCKDRGSPIYVNTLPADLHFVD